MNEPRVTHAHRARASNRAAALAWPAVLGLVAACGVETYRERLPARDLSLRWVATSGGEGVDTLPHRGRAGTLAVERAVVVDADHIRHVRLLDGADGQRVIVLETDDVGQARLRAASETHPGRRLAVVAGGRVVSAPTVRGPLTEREVHVSGPPDEIEETFGRLSR
jgi:hypothetical protein